MTYRTSKSDGVPFLIYQLEAALGEWGWSVTEEGDDLYLIDVGEDDKPRFLLSVDYRGKEKEVDVHLDRGPGVDVHEDTFPVTSWRGKVCGWVVAKLRDLGIKPVRAGGAS